MSGNMFVVIDRRLRYRYQLGTSSSQSHVRTTDSVILLRAIFYKPFDRALRNTGTRSPASHNILFSQTIP